MMHYWFVTTDAFKCKQQFNAVAGGDGADVSDSLNCGSFISSNASYLVKGITSFVCKILKALHSHSPPTQVLPLVLPY